MLLHIPLIETCDRNLAKDARLNIWTSLTVHTRLLCVFLLVFAIALTPMGRWWTWAIYGVITLPILYWSHVDLQILGKRMAIESAFMSVILLGTLFRDGGEVVWQWEGFKITTQGLIVLGSVSIRAFLSLLLLNILTISISIPLLLQSLVILRMPPLLVSILASMYRYMGVLTNEFNAMRRAATARNFAPRHLCDRNRDDLPWQRQVLGNMLGMLFIRTYDRGDRIYQAMLARGYQGVPTIHESAAMGWRDRVALGCLILLILFISNYI
ncbi:cobalt ECF transporter T component CbiQ [Pseudanabaena mucicola]|uniref:Cobalt ECF transporter T component CbiQ n=1 Tax=Pseudanabaena mucicola FACHB-723 TaxID=2692860 RepID=A0ABR7ZW03_9CYAN|nr:cobalt ECF transporter T component CbiQ [Pseudanabaena mucicola]MBD2188009.1 cobalt ECF transporter T component CbiQ [Pseudanabaena mucicola FACHB-723]